MLDKRFEDLAKKAMNTDDGLYEELDDFDDEFMCEDEEDDDDADCIVD